MTILNKLHFKRLLWLRDAAYVCQFDLVDGQRRTCHFKVCSHAADCAHQEASGQLLGNARVRAGAKRLRCVDTAGATNLDQVDRKPRAFGHRCAFKLDCLQRVARHERSKGRVRRQRGVDQRTSARQNRLKLRIRLVQRASVLRSLEFGANCLIYKYIIHIYALMKQPQLPPTQPNSDTSNEDSMHTCCSFGVFHQRDNAACQARRGRVVAADANADNVGQKFFVGQRLGQRLVLFQHGVQERVAVLAFARRLEQRAANVALQAN